MKHAFPLRPIASSLVFGILLIWLDFGDASPLSNGIGNLDQVFGSTFWYPTEAFLLIASVTIFILFGKFSFDIGRSERTDGITPKMFSLATNARSVLFFLLYIILLVLVDIDDILKALGIRSALQTSSTSPTYWVPMEVIYPLLSMVVFLAFGKASYEIGARGN